MKTSTERSFVIVGAVCGLLALAGCATAPSQSSSSGGSMVVIGTVYESPAIDGAGKVHKAEASVVAKRDKGQTAIDGQGYYSENPWFDNMTTMTAPPSMVVMLSSKLATNALIQSSQAGKWTLKLEKKGDSFSITSSSQCPIGVGSKMRFSADEWVDFLGAKYRKGGFKVSQNGIQFDDSTEKNDGGNVLRYQNGQWVPVP